MKEKHRFKLMKLQLRVHRSIRLPMRCLVTPMYTKRYPKATRDYIFRLFKEELRY